MITDASRFRPLQPRRLVPAGAGVELDGPGTRFRAGQLVEEPTEGRVWSLTLVQLADSNR